MNNSKIVYNVKKLEELYENYSKTIFDKAFEKLTRFGFLNLEEKRIFIVVKSEIEVDKRFLCKSYFSSYLNLIINGKSKRQIIYGKENFILEVCLMLLEIGKIESFSVSFENVISSSLFLQRKIPQKFDRVSFQDFKFVFETALGNFKISKKEVLVYDKIRFEFVDKNYYGKFYEKSQISDEKWIENFKMAFEILEKCSDSFSEIKNFLDFVAPYGFSDNNQNSMSYLFYPGIIYSSFVEDPIVQAEAIVHEVHHSIIFIYSLFDMVIENLSDYSYYSSVQEKPRSLEKCILAVHAFVAVENFYREIISKKIVKEKDYILRFFLSFLKNEKLLDVVLKYGKFTSKGKDFFNDILLKHRKNEKFFEDMKLKFALEFEKASKECDKHLNCVLEQFVDIKY